MKHIIVCLILVIFISCKEETKKKLIKAVPGPTGQVQSALVINGKAMLGPIEGASVSLHPLLSTGELNKTVIIAEAKTNLDGEFKFNLNDTKYINKPLGIYVQGGSYKEESGGEIVKLTNTGLSSLVTHTQKPGTQINAAVSPLSEIAFQYFKAHSKNNKNLNLLEKAKEANAKVASSFGLKGFSSELPVEPESKIPNNVNGQHTVVLAAISHMAHELGTDSVAMTNALAKHYVKHGALKNLGSEQISVTDAQGNSLNVQPPTINTVATYIQQIGNGKIEISGLVTDPNFSAPVLPEAEIEVKAEEAKKRSCLVVNGNGEQVWNGSDWSNCEILECDTNYLKTNNSCVALTRQCQVQNGRGNQTWEAVNENQWGPCLVNQCNANFTLINNSCAANSRSCVVGNANGTQLWNGSSWGQCEISSCPINTTKINNSCVPNIQSCTINNGIGSQTWNGTNWGTCQISSCSTNFTKSGNSCLPNSQACTVPNGTGTQTWTGSSFSSCQVQSCQTNYTLINNSCVANSRSCTVANGTGSQALSGSTWGECVVTSCQSNFTKFGNTCVANSQSCTIANGTGSQAWNGNSFGTCMVTSCQASFHQENNSCVYNTKGCSLPNALSAMQSWNGSSWGSCNVITCNSGFVNSGNTCVAESNGGGTKSTTTCPSGWVCPSSPLYTSNIGAWYSIYWNAPGKPHSHWSEWTRYRPVLGYYDSSDPNVITTHFTQMKSAGVNFVIFDHTNGIGNDGGTIDQNARAVINVNNSLGSNAQLNYSFAIGYALWGAQNVDAQKSEADWIWNHYAQGPLHYRINGKPLMVLLNNFQHQNCFMCEWQDSRFSVRPAAGYVDGLNPVVQKYAATGLWGWVIKTPQVSSPEAITVMPGWYARHHTNRPHEYDPIYRDDGRYYMRLWINAIKENPRHIVIASWNDWGEETSIEPAIAVNAPKFVDSYGTETPNLYLQITTAYGNLKKGLMPGYYYKDEDLNEVYLVADGKLHLQTAMPRGHAVIALPAGTIKNLLSNNSGGGTQTPIAGGWSEWINTTSCNPSTSTLTQSRTCNSPTPMYGGAPCSGSSTRVISCTPEVSLSPIPEGLFRLNTQYGYSSGSIAYCTFDNYENFKYITGRTDGSGVREVSQIPSSMRSDGHCAIPAGLFRIKIPTGYTLGYSNGAGYCLFDNMTNYTRITGKTNADGIRDFANIPSTMRYDGICTGN